jgi:hypothetical protein
VKADTRTLQRVMQGDRRFVVPVYQRPYVWDQEKQWEPLSCVLSTRVLRWALSPSQNSLSRCLREELGALLEGRVALGPAREPTFGPSR